MSSGKVLLDSEPAGRKLGFAATLPQIDSVHFCRWKRLGSAASPVLVSLMEVMDGQKQKFNSAI
jgi:hypothetical protein